MAVEVRRVILGWEHPKNKKGIFIPLYKQSFKKAVKDCDDADRIWKNGYRISPNGDRIPIEPLSYHQFAGIRPHNQIRYMPDWSQEEKTHWQMYEIVSEGTPISPVMPSPKLLAQWLTVNKVSRFSSVQATYAEWLKLIREDRCFSM